MSCPVTFNNSPLLNLNLPPQNSPYLPFTTRYLTTLFTPLLSHDSSLFLWSQNNYQLYHQESCGLHSPTVTAARPSNTSTPPSPYRSWNASTHSFLFFDSLPFVSLLPLLFSCSLILEDLIPFIGTILTLSDTFLLRMRSLPSTLYSKWLPPFGKFQETPRSSLKFAKSGSISAMIR